MIKYNGFDLKITCDCEYQDIEEALGYGFTGVDHSDTIEKVKCGELEHLIIDVSAYKCGIELASTSLGNCIGESFEAILQDWVGGYLPQMCDEAVEEAKHVLSCLNKGITL